MTKPEIILLYHHECEDLRIPLWLLYKGGEIETLVEPEFEGRTFKIHTPEAVFYFIHRQTPGFRERQQEFQDMDNVWYIGHHGIEETDLFKNKIYAKLCDLNMDQPESLFLKWLDEGHILLFGTNVPAIKHKNFIQDYMFQLWGFYHRKGMVYNNIYSDITAPREHLLGVYHYGPHNSWGEILLEREELFNGCKEILKDDMITYQYDSEHSYMDILNRYNYIGQWDRVDVSGYTDYIRSVANLVWESRGQVHNANLYLPKDDIMCRDHMTEKTLKAILYSKTKTFFLLASNGRQTKWLMENGFWFLNYEFYKKDPDEITYEDMLQSIFDTSQYLLDLKKSFGSNQKVHEFLVAVYGDKLENNYTRMMEMLKAGPPDDQINRFKDALLRIVKP